MSRRTRTISCLLQFLTAAILLQTLFFKFTGAAESKFIFSTLGVEPWGRYASGIVEFIAAFLLLIPRTITFGAILTLAVILGAIVSHLTRLGVVVQNDGGLLFSLACVVFIASSTVLVLRRRELATIAGRLLPMALAHGNSR